MTAYNFLGNDDPNTLLLQAGQSLHVKSLSGQPHPILMSKAAEHAAYQAQHQQQGHQLWDERYHELYRLMPECDSFSEVCAESWPEQGAQDAAAEMYNSWRQSPSHWLAVNGPCDFYGYAMAYCEANKTWYACGQFGHLGEPTSS